MKLHVNGKNHELDVEPEMPLLWALRDELDIKGPKYGCGIAQCGEVILMGMHAAVTNETDQVQAGMFRLSEGFLEHGDVFHFAIGDGLIYASEILINDASRAEVEVADFAISHLTIR